jgi:hypothetical protein
MPPTSTRPTLPMTAFYCTIAAGIRRVPEPFIPPRLECLQPGQPLQGRVSYQVLARTLRDDLKPRIRATPRSGLAPQEVLDAIKDERHSDAYGDEPPDPRVLWLESPVPPGTTGVKLRARKNGQNHHKATDTNFKPSHSRSAANANLNKGVRYLFSGDRASAACFPVRIAQRLLTPISPNHTAGSS